MAGCGGGGPSSGPPPWKGLSRSARPASNGSRVWPRAWLPTFLALFLACLGLGLGPQPVSAAVRTFIGGGPDNLWSTAQNWLGATPPTSSEDDVFLDPGTTSRIDTTTVQIRMLQFGEGSHLLLADARLEVRQTTHALAELQPTGTRLTFVGGSSILSELFRVETLASDPSLTAAQLLLEGPASYVEQNFIFRKTELGPGAALTLRTASLRFDFITAPMSSPGSVVSLTGLEQATITLAGSQVTYVDLSSWHVTAQQTLKVAGGNRFRVGRLDALVVDLVDPGQQLEVLDRWIVGVGRTYLAQVLGPAGSRLAAYGEVRIEGGRLRNGVEIALAGDARGQFVGTFISYVTDGSRLVLEDTAELEMQDLAVLSFFNTEGDPGSTQELELRDYSVLRITGSTGQGQIVGPGGVVRVQANAQIANSNYLLLRNITVELAGSLLSTTPSGFDPVSGTGGGAVRLDTGGVLKVSNGGVVQLAPNRDFITRAGSHIYFQAGSLLRATIPGSPESLPGRLWVINSQATLPWTTHGRPRLRLEGSFAAAQSGMPGALEWDQVYSLGSSRLELPPDAWMSASAVQASSGSPNPPEGSPVSSFGRLEVFSSAVGPNGDHGGVLQADQRSFEVFENSTLVVMGAAAIRVIHDASQSPVQPLHMGLGQTSHFELRNQSRFLVGGWVKTDFNPAVRVRDQALVRVESSGGNLWVSDLNHGPLFRVICAQPPLEAPSGCGRVEFLGRVEVENYWNIANPDLALWTPHLSAMALPSSLNRMLVLERLSSIEFAGELRMRPNAWLAVFGSDHSNAGAGLPPGTQVRIAATANLTLERFSRMIFAQRSTVSWSSLAWAENPAEELDGSLGWAADSGSAFVHFMGRSQLVWQQEEDGSEAGMMAGVNGVMASRPKGADNTGVKMSHNNNNNVNRVNNNNENNSDNNNNDHNIANAGSRSSTNTDASSDIGNSLKSNSYDYSSSSSSSSSRDSIINHIITLNTHNNDYDDHHTVQASKNTNANTHNNNNDYGVHTAEDDDDDVASLLPIAISAIGSTLNFESAIPSSPTSKGARIGALWLLTRALDTTGAETQLLGPTTGPGMIAGRILARPRGSPGTNLVDPTEDPVVIRGRVASWQDLHVWAVNLRLEEPVSSSQALGGSAEHGSGAGTDSGDVVVSRVSGAGAASVTGGTVGDHSDATSVGDSYRSVGDRSHATSVGDRRVGDNRSAGAHNTHTDYHHRASRHDAHDATTATTTISARASATTPSTNPIASTTSTASSTESVPATRLAIRAVFPSAGTENPPILWILARVQLGTGGAGSSSTTTSSSSTTNNSFGSRPVEVVMGTGAQGLFIDSVVRFVRAPTPTTATSGDDDDGSGTPRIVWLDGSNFHIAATHLQRVGRHGEPEDKNGALQPTHWGAWRSANLVVAPQAALRVLAAASSPVTTLDAWLVLQGRLFVRPGIVLEIGEHGWLLGLGDLALEQGGRLRVIPSSAQGGGGVVQLERTAALHSLLSSGALRMTGLPRVDLIGGANASLPGSAGPGSRLDASFEVWWPRAPGSDPSADIPNHAVANLHWMKPWTGRWARTVACYNDLSPMALQALVAQPKDGVTYRFDWSTQHAPPSEPVPVPWRGACDLWKPRQGASGGVPLVERSLAMSQRPTDRWSVPVQLEFPAGVWLRPGSAPSQVCEQVFDAADLTALADLIMTACDVDVGGGDGGNPAPSVLACEAIADDSEEPEIYTRVVIDLPGCLLDNSDDPQVITARLPRSLGLNTQPASSGLLPRLPVFADAITEAQTGTQPNARAQISPPPSLRVEFEYPLAPETLTIPGMLHPTVIPYCKPQAVFQLAPDAWLEQATFAGRAYTVDWVFDWFSGGRPSEVERRSVDSKANIAVEAPMEAAGRNATVSATLVNMFGVRGPAYSVVVPFDEIPTPEVELRLPGTTATVAETVYAQVLAAFPPECSNPDAGPLRLSFRWSLLRLSPVGDDESAEIVERTVVGHQARLQLAPGALRVSTRYRFELELAVNADAQGEGGKRLVFAPKDHTLHVVRMPLQVRVPGGSQRTQPSSSLLVLDGSGSTDPNYPGVDPSVHFAYAWNCTRTAAVPGSGGEPVPDDCATRLLEAGIPTNQSRLVIPPDLLPAGSVYSFTLRFTSTASGSPESASSSPAVSVEMTASSEPLPALWLAGPAAEEPPSARQTVRLQGLRLERDPVSGTLVTRPLAGGPWRMRWSSVAVVEEESSESSEIENSVNSVNVVNSVNNNGFGGSRGNRNTVVRTNRNRNSNNRNSNTWSSNNNNNNNNGIIKNSGINNHNVLNSNQNSNSNNNNQNTNTNTANNHNLNNNNINVRNNGINTNYNTNTYNSNNGDFSPTSGEPANHRQLNLTHLQEQGLLGSSPDSASLVLLPGALEAGATYTFELQVWHPDRPGLGSASARIVVQVNAAPTGGACSVFPASGAAFTTQFRVECAGWSDPHAPLVYTLQSRPVALDGVPVSPEAPWSVMSADSLSRTFVSVYPTRRGVNATRYELRVTVKDRLGAGADTGVTGGIDSGSGGGGGVESSQIEVVSGMGLPPPSNGGGDGGSGGGGGGQLVNDPIECLCHTAARFQLQAALDTGDRDLLFPLLRALLELLVEDTGLRSNETDWRDGSALVACDPAHLPELSPEEAGRSLNQFRAQVFGELLSVLARGVDQLEGGSGSGSDGAFGVFGDHISMTSRANSIVPGIPTDSLGVERGDSVMYVRVATVFGANDNGNQNDNIRAVGDSDGIIHHQQASSVPSYHQPATGVVPNYHQPATGVVPNYHQPNSPTRAAAAAQILAKSPNSAFQHPRSPQSMLREALVRLAAAETSGAITQDLAVQLTDILILVVQFPIEELDAVLAEDVFAVLNAVIAGVGDNRELAQRVVLVLSELLETVQCSLFDRIVALVRIFSLAIRQGSLPEETVDDLLSPNLRSGGSRGHIGGDDGDGSGSGSGSTNITLRSEDLEFSISPDLAAEFDGELGGLSFVDVTVNRFGGAVRRCRPGSAGDVIKIDVGTGGDKPPGSQINGSFVFDLPLDPEVGSLWAGKSYSLEGRCGAELPVCGWWSTSSSGSTGDEEPAWVTEGCAPASDTPVRVLPSGGYALTCKCDHLTEFAALLRRLGSPDEDGCGGTLSSGLSDSEKRMYSVFGILYSLVEAVVLLQIARLVLATRVMGQSFLSLGPSSQHLLVGLAALGRLLSSFWYAGWYELGLFPAALVSSLPYLMAFWVFSLLLFQWHAVVYRPMSRAADAFAQIRPYFIGLNLGAVAIIATLFAAILADPESGFAADMALVGSIVMAVFTLGMGVLYVVYAHAVASFISETTTRSNHQTGRARLHTAEGPSTGGSHTNGDSDRDCCPSVFGSDVATRMRRLGLWISLCFLAQSAMWVGSAVADRQESDAATLLRAVFLGVDLLSLVAVLVLYARFVSQLRAQASSKKANGGTDSEWGSDASSTTRTSSTVGRRGTVLTSRPLEAPDYDEDGDYDGGEGQGGGFDELDVLEAGEADWDMDSDDGDDAGNHGGNNSHHHGGGGSPSPRAVRKASSASAASAVRSRAHSRASSKSSAAPRKMMSGNHNHNHNHNTRSGRPTRSPPRSPRLEVAASPILDDGGLEMAELGRAATHVDSQDHDFKDGNKAKKLRKQSEKQSAKENDKDKDKKKKKATSTKSSSSGKPKPAQNEDEQKQGKPEKKAETKTKSAAKQSGGHRNKSKSHAVAATAAADEDELPPPELSDSSSSSSSSSDDSDSD